MKNFEKKSKKKTIVGGVYKWDSLGKSGKSVPIIESVPFIGFLRVIPCFQTPTLCKKKNLHNKKEKKGRTQDPRFKTKI